MSLIDYEKFWEMGKRLQNRIRGVKCFLKLDSDPGISFQKHDQNSAIAIYIRINRGFLVIIAGFICEWTVHNLKKNLQSKTALSAGTLKNEFRKKN